MIFNNFFSIIIITAIFRAMQVDTSSSRNVSDLDSEFKKALKLDTGFTYSEHNQFYLLKFKKIMELLEIKELPKGNTMKSAFDIIYTDLVCGNLYLLKNYLLLCQNINDYYLDESITRHMLASVLKINQINYVDPFWYIHMYTLYRSMFLNEADKDHICFINKVKYDISERFNTMIEKWCRKNNRYINTVKNNDKKIEIENLIKIINNRQKNNDILLENETEENWVSLKSIYLHKIIEEDQNCLKTIIMTFGDQDEIVYKSIRDDIVNYYELAKNYYYYDDWVTQIRVYLESMVNIIKIAALHLIRNHLYYTHQYWQSKSSIIRNVDVGYSEIKELLLNNNLFEKLFKSDKSKILEIIKNLTINIFSNIHRSHIIIISTIDITIKNLLSKFVLRKSDTLFNANFINHIRAKNEKYKGNLSKEDSIKVENFKQKFKYPSLSDSYERIIAYLHYLDTIFEGYNIETTLSYIINFKNYKGISHNVVRQTNTENVIKF